MRYIVLTLALFLSLSSYADCDLFKEEVRIIAEEVDDLKKKLNESKTFIKKADENRTETDNEKMARYLKASKDKLDLLDHGMSQLKLHQDCACENFKFDYVDNLIIELKFWLKKARSIETEKPKKTDYATIEKYTEKAIDKSNSLFSYMQEPCKEDFVEEPTLTNASMEDSTAVAESEEPIVEETSDTTAMAENLGQPAEESVLNEESDEPEAVADTSSTNDAKPEKRNEEMAVSSESGNSTEAPSGSGGSGAAIGAAAAGVAAAGVAAGIIAGGDNDKDSTATEIEPEQEELAIATEPSSIDSSSTDEANPEKRSDEIADSNNGNGSTGTLSGSGGEGAAIGAAAAGVAAAGAAAGIIAGGDKDQDSTATEVEREAEELVVEEEPVGEATAAVPIMDTVVAATSFSSTPIDSVTTEPEIAEEQSITSQEPVAEPEPEPVVVVLPTPKLDSPPAPVPADFHYAVQITTGNPDLKSDKYTSLNEDIYMVEESGMNKYRIGKYKSIKEAVNTKNKAFNGGFIDAFVVAYNNGERISMSEAKNLEKGIPAPVASSSGNSNSNTPKTSSTPQPKAGKIKKKSEVFLAVQVGANILSTDPVYELIKYEKMVGMEVHVIHGSPVRFYTGNATTETDARRILQTVRMNGVEEAFLIGIADGKRIDYNQALEHLSQ